MKKHFLFALVATAVLALSGGQAFGQYARHSPLLNRTHATDSNTLVTRTVKLPIIPEHRDAFLKATTALEAATRPETGCLSYHFYEDPSARNTFLLLEEWATEAALEAHRKQPYVTAYRQQLPAWLASAATATVYQVTKRSATTTLPAKK